MYNCFLNMLLHYDAQQYLTIQSSHSANAVLGPVKHIGQREEKDKGLGICQNL